MATKPIILVGNSINQLMKGKSWDDVLKDLRSAACCPDCLRGNLKPYTIYFEELYWRARSAGVDRGSFLEAVAKPYLRLTCTPYHTRLMNLDVNHVLTTNYDYSLEKAHLGRAPRTQPVDRWEIAESKFSLFRRNKVNDRWIWHIHGEANVPSSIMLGHDHYVSYAGQLREYWNRGVSYDAPGKVTRAIRRTFAQFEQSPKPYTWLDLFVRDPVHICGLSFDFSETVLWYALSRRRVFTDYAGLRDSTKCPPGACEMSSVFYHYFRKRAKDEALEARLEVLQAMGITCVPYQVAGDDYGAAWDQMLGHLEREVGSRPLVYADPQSTKSAT